MECVPITVETISANVIRSDDIITFALMLLVSLTITTKQKRDIFDN